MDPWTNLAELPDVPDHKMNEFLALVADEINDRKITFKAPNKPAGLVLLARLFCASYRVTPGALSMLYSGAQASARVSALNLSKRKRHILPPIAELAKANLETTMEGAFVRGARGRLSVISQISPMELAEACQDVEFLSTVRCFAR